MRRRHVSTAFTVKPLAGTAIAITASPDTTCGPTSPRPPSGGLAGWQVKRVKLYIDAHLAERITCRELANLVNLSAGHFGRRFVTALGQSPRQYILRCRMELAKLAMRTTYLSLAQILLECGMADQPHFCRSFLRIFGDSPSVWCRNDGAGRASTSSSYAAKTVRSGRTGSPSAPARHSPGTGRH
jgi:transcriptional regulator GlxA family with amidase domain